MIREIRAAHRRRLLLALIPTLILCAASYAWLDRPATLWFHAHLGPTASGAFRWITAFGQSEYELVPSALLFLACRRMNTPRTRLIAMGAAYVFLSVAASGLAVDVVKFIIGRHRPADLIELGLYGFQPLHGGFRLASFPSGHTQTAFAFAVPLMRLMPRWRWWWLAVALAIAASRIVLSEHYPADALMGAWFGWAGAVLIGDWMEARGVLSRQGQVRQG